MHFQSETVAQAVAEKVPISALLNVVASDGVGIPTGHSGPNAVRRAFVRGADDVVDLTLFGARAADHEVRCRHFVDHGVQKGGRARRNPGSLVALTHRLQIALTGLVHDLEAWAPPRQFRRCLHNGHVDDVRALVATLVQTDRFGTSVSQALRIHSDSLRTERRQRAEEQAAKTTIKMIIPLVLFVLPSIIFVTLGPAIIQLFRILAPGAH